MVPATNEFKVCPICNGPLHYKTWEDPKEAMTYLKLYCPNGCDYDKSYATNTQDFREALIKQESRHGR